MRNGQELTPTFFAAPDVQRPRGHSNLSAVSCQEDSAPDGQKTRTYSNHSVAPDVQRPRGQSNLSAATCHEDAVSSDGHEEEFSSGIRRQSEYVTELFSAGAHARKSLLARIEELEFAKTVDSVAVATKAPSVVQNAPKQNSAPPVTPVVRVETPLAKQEKELHKLELAKQEKELAKQEKGRTQAEERAKSAEKEQVKNRAELERVKAMLEEEAEARRAQDYELKLALDKIEQQSREIEKLRMLVDELARDDGKSKDSKEKLKSVGLVWRTPTQQVFERLFQDAVDRDERRRNLIVSLEQARDEQALDIFKSSFLQCSNYDISGCPESYEDTTSFGPGVVKSQARNWLVDNSHNSWVSLRTLASTEVAHLHAHTNIETRFAVSPEHETTLNAGRSSSPQRVQTMAPSPPLNGIPYPFPRTSSPQRACSPEADLGVEGRQVGTRSRSNSPDEAAVRAAMMAEQEIDKFTSSGFAAALGLTHNRNSAEVWQPSLRARSPKPTGSRPTSASSSKALRKARATITARPRSAALPALQRVQRPHSEASLLKEAQRLLAAPANPTAKLGRSASAPSVRRGLPGRPQIAAGT